MWVIRYDTKAEFDVDSKAEYQLNSTGIRKMEKKKLHVKTNKCQCPFNSVQFQDP